MRHLLALATLAITRGGAPDTSSTQRAPHTLAAAEETDALAQIQSFASGAARRTTGPLWMM